MTVHPDSERGFGLLGNGSQEAVAERFD